jgi:hypothetical protein
LPTPLFDIEPKFPPIRRLVVAMKEWQSFLIVGVF